jgi:hypothetical protein
MNSLASTNSVQKSIEEILGLNDMSNAERQMFLESVGALIIESAVLKYVVGISEQARSTFGEWLENNQYKRTFFEQAFQNHPEFADVLAEEMQSFQSETFQLFDTVSAV